MFLIKSAKVHPQIALDFFTGIRIYFTHSQLEIKTAFTGAIRQSLDPAMIQIATPIENHLFNTFAFGKFGDLQSDLARLLGFLEPGCGDKLPKVNIN